MGVDIIFLTETDTKQIICEADYQIKGYRTIFQERKNPNDLLRIVCLVKDEWFSKIEIREDLMSWDFPSIWVEICKENKKPVFVAGIYREWTQNGDKTEEGQIKRIKIFSNQMELAIKHYFCITLMYQSLTKGFSCTFANIVFQYPL